MYMETQKIISKEFVKFWERNKRSLVITIIMLIIAYGMKIFHLAISHDTEAIISVADSLYGSWLSMGRFGLVALKYLFDLEIFNPYLASVFTFIMLLANTILWEYLFWRITVYRKNFFRWSWVFPVLFLTAPIMADQISFLLQAFEVQLSILMVGVSLFLLWPRRRAKYRGCGYVIAGGLLALSFSCYQSTVPLFIAGTIACFLLAFPVIRRKWTVIFRLIAFFILSFLAYELINRIVMYCMNISPTAYISDQILWGSNSFKECLKNILRHIWDVVAGNGIFYSCAYSVSVILLAVLIIYKIIKRQKELVVFILASLILAVSPFLMTILMGQAPSTRVQIVLPFVFGFVIQYFLIWWEQNAFSRKGLVTKINIIFGLFLLALGLEQCVWDARIFYTEYVVYEEDVRLATKISDRIEKLNLGESPAEPVVFIGYRQPGLNPSTYSHITLSGYSFFEISYSTAHGTWVMRNFMETLGYNYVDPSGEQIAVAEEYAKNMDSWPNSGSVAEHDGVIIVKLSE